MRRNSQHAQSEAEAEANAGDRGRIMSATDHNAILRHIKKVVQPIYRSQNVFEGINALIQAAGDGRLRRGQIIFGTCSFAHLGGEDNTQVGNILNSIAPVLTGLFTGQARTHPFFHVAVYAGQVRSTQGPVHYVIENGGEME